MASMQWNGFGIHENEAQGAQTISINSENKINFPFVPLTIYENIE